jgi:uncharacterized XkdX family phage protein
MKIILDRNQTVVAKAKEVKVVSGGLMLDNAVVLGEAGLTVIETDLNPRNFKDKIVNGKIVPNGDYVEPEHEHLKEFVNNKTITKEQYQKITGMLFVPTVVEESVEAK